MKIKVSKESIDKLFEYYSQYHDSSLEWSIKAKVLEKAYEIADDLETQTNNKYSFTVFIDLTYILVRAGKPVQVLYEMLNLIDIEVME